MANRKYCNGSIGGIPCAKRLPHPCQSECRLCVRRMKHGHQIFLCRTFRDLRGFRPAVASIGKAAEEMQLLHEPCYFAIRNPVQTLGLALATVLGFALAAVAQAAVKNVVIVHGAFADGSGWKPVAEILRRDGYSV